MDELLQDLDEDVEGMQGTIYYLQQELKKSKEKISDLEVKKNQELLKLVDDSSLILRKDGKGGHATIADDELLKTVAKAEGEDESSDDSSCLILKVNPEEEYESMFNDEITKTEGKPIESTTKRGIVDGDFEQVLAKKVKRTSNSKKEVDED